MANIPKTLIHVMWRTLGLVCILQVAICQHGCLANCHCKDFLKTPAEHRVICKNVSHPQETLTSLPSNTTHLLLILARSEDTKSTVDVSFNGLPHLEVVLLDIPKGLSRLQLQLKSTSLINNTKIRVFRSRVPLFLKYDTFSPLHNLEEITLTGTQMDWDFVPEMMNHSFSDKIKLISLSLRKFSRYWSNSKNLAYFEPHKIFSALHQRSIQHLDLSGNDIHVLSPTFHKVFPELQNLDFSYNMLTRPTAKIGFPYEFEPSFWIELCLFKPTMKHLDVSRQGKSLSQDTMYTESDFINRIISSSEKYVQPEKVTPSSVTNCSACLQHFYSNHRCACVPLFGLQSFSLAAFEAIDTSMRWNVGKFTDIYILNNSFSYIDLSGNYNYHITNVQNLRIFGLNKLEYANLQNNGIGFFNESFFKNFRFLKVLLLGGNNLYQSLTTKQSQLYLKENFHLEVVDLSYNKLVHIPYTLFDNISSLKHLNLSHNFLTSINVSLIGLEKLEILNISFNRLETISNQMQNELDLLRYSARKLSVDMSKNPFLCGCDSLFFLKWFQTTGVHFINKANYTCGHPSHGYVTMMDVSVEELHKFCHPSLTRTIILAVVITTVITIAFVLVIMIYCKRWRLRYWWYLTQKGWKQLSNNDESIDYDYDVFVAYNWQDSPWVHGSLLQEMEEKRGLKLCIHQRDFIPGEVLEEVIVEKIQKSRKTLLVLTPNFVNSNWCHFELHMARNRLCEKGEDVLVLVILQPLSPSSVSGTMYQLLKKKLYLEWPGNAAGHDLFWQKLSDAFAKNGRECRPFD